jgi:hypothetical protein
LPNSGLSAYPGVTGIREMVPSVESNMRRESEIIYRVDIVPIGDVDD